MDLLWLGYNGLSVRYADIVAVLFYRSAFDGRIHGACGRIPENVRSVVVTSDGAYWPSSWQVEQLRQRLAFWRAQQSAIG